MRIILVTGGSGMMGSEAVEYCDGQGHRVIGVDNNMLYPLSRYRGAVAFDLEQTFMLVVGPELGRLNPKSTNRAAQRIEEDLRIHPIQLLRWTQRVFSRRTKRARECR